MPTCGDCFTLKKSPQILRRLQFKFFFLVICIIPSIAASFETKIQTGDILLMSANCTLCPLIEKEENSPFSHLGIAILEKSNASGDVQSEISILESWNRVEKTPLAEFIKRKRNETTIQIIRPIDCDGKDLTFHTEGFLQSFEKNFNGKNYDPFFLWDNQNTRGEMYYCSEFTAKFLNLFLPVPITPKAMHFQVERAQWIKYFRGDPPDGKPGISPADFSRSLLFRYVDSL